MGDRERGAAMVMVLMLVAVLSLLAVHLNELMRFGVQRIVNRTQSEQAYWYAQGGEVLARLKLQAALEQSPAAVERLLQGSALRYPIDGGNVKVSLSGVQSCFNLTSLSYAQSPSLSLQRWRALGEVLALDALRFERFTDQLQDWLDTDSRPRQHGGESPMYLMRAFPHFSQDTPLMWLAEAAPIWPLFADTGWQALKRLLCVRAGDGRLVLNPNDLQERHAALVSAFLLNRLSPEQVKVALALKTGNGYAHLDQFFTSPMGKALSLQEGEKGVFSLERRDFTVLVEVSYRKASYVFHTALQWQGNTLTKRFSQAGYIP